MEYPYIIDPEATFKAVVRWIHDKVVVLRKAPGFIVGLSGTDSLVVFLAAYEALKKAGKPGRLLGVHFGPSEDFLLDHPESEAHLWFGQQVVPWLRDRCPGAAVEVNTSIDWRLDGLRWGKLLDMSILTVDEDDKRELRPSEEKYWVVGTRNRSEEELFTYSRASLAASVQPIVHLWKNEILQVSRHLGVPQVAVDKSCESDCMCGRDRLPARHPGELDALLMVRCGELAADRVAGMEPNLKRMLEVYISSQIERCGFKASIPYRPTPYESPIRVDPLVAEFEEGSLDLRKFNHHSHLYVAWCYLRSMALDEAVERYSSRLRRMLAKVGRSDKFSDEVTRSYFVKLRDAMARRPSAWFAELADQEPELGWKRP